MAGKSLWHVLAFLHFSTLKSILGEKNAERQKKIYLRQHDLDWLFRKGLRTFSFCSEKLLYIFAHSRHEAVNQKCIFYPSHIHKPHTIKSSVVFFLFFLLLHRHTHTHTYLNFKSLNFTWLVPLLLLFFMLFLLHFIIIWFEERSLHKWIVSSSVQCADSGLG